jgi:hypothetical protein
MKHSHTTECPCCKGQGELIVFDEMRGLFYFAMCTHCMGKREMAIEVNPEENDDG